MKIYDDIKLGYICSCNKNPCSGMDIHVQRVVIKVGDLIWSVRTNAFKIVNELNQFENLKDKIDWMNIQSDNSRYEVEILENNAVIRWKEKDEI